ncbi:MAG: hypothetical protein R3F61_38280 [Myxococcota bacterium]
MIPVAAEMGAIEGGWEFVIAAYALTWSVFALYTLSLWARARREES